MTTKLELDNHFNALERTQRLKKSLQTLKIEWETDLDKMDFSALRTGPAYDSEAKHQKIRVDVIDISNEWDDLQKKDLEKDFFSNIATLNLIEFIAKGNKIIPPLYLQNLEYCGDTFTTKVQGIHRADGAHRVFVSFILGLKEIPIVLVEKIGKFSFPSDKWDFEYTDNLLIAKSKNGNHRIELDNTRIVIDTTMFYENILSITV